MIRLLDFPRDNVFFNFRNHQFSVSNSTIVLQQESGFRPRNFRKKKRSILRFSSPVRCKLVNQAECSVVQKDSCADSGKFSSFPHVQTLRNFPKEELFRKAVMVRFDPLILFQKRKEYRTPLLENGFATIRYLYEAGANIILVSRWNEPANSRFSSGAYSSTEAVVDFLSSVLELEVIPVKFASRLTHLYTEDFKRHGILLLENIFHFKGERSNCSKFSRELASGIDILVNDAFSEAHKVLASTVGVTTFCNACIAGFYLEESVYRLKGLIKTAQKPYMAIIGGGKLADKSAALMFLASKCDGLIFVGSMAFQIMHALGQCVPMKFVKNEALKEAISIVEIAKSRNIPLILPIDVWCFKEHYPIQMDVFSTCSIPEGWQPFDIGPKSVQEMYDLLSQCKKILWIGSLKACSKQEKYGTFELAEAVGNLNNCDVTFVGKTGFDLLLDKPEFYLSNKFFKDASILWEVLKGRKLQGLLALDRAYPFQIDWTIAYDDPMKPLVVDIGSGNGLFLFGMALKTKDMNFLGLEMNAKLVDRCLDDVQRFAIRNVHFITTNATSTFQSIVSSYPGEFLLASIQCPNPDFNKPEHRWRMLQRSLVEAISDTLLFGGKVFLQSDIEAVTSRMKSEFLKYSKGKLVLAESTEDTAINEAGWLEQNPFGVPSDWEQHVLDRGDPMYRLLLVKVKGINGKS